MGVTKLDALYEAVISCNAANDAMKAYGIVDHYVIVIPLWLLIERPSTNP